MKKMIYIITACLVLFCCVQNASAQYPFHEDIYFTRDLVYEAGASVGMMNCFTDLGGNKGIGKKFVKDYNMGDSEIDASIYLNMLYKYAIGLRLEVTFGKVKADDKSLESVRQSTLGRYERNLSFRSKINEVALIAEIHPVFFKKYKYGNKLPRISPYLLGGIGFFKFNPQAKLNDEWIDLQPLSTEGQGLKEYPDRKPYKLTQLVCPVGVGVKYKVSPVLNVSLECTSRILFTDYLDDVSTFYIDPNVYNQYFSGTQLSNALMLNDRQKELNPSHNTNIGYERGNPKNNDSYFTFNIRFAALL